MDQDWPAQSSELWPIEKITPYARNSRTHSDEQVAQIAASIREWGWTNPILVDEDGGLIAGHGRLLAARKLGLAQIPTMVAKGWSEAQKKAYVIADNKLALNAGWDLELLAVELGDLQGFDFNLLLTGFSDDELGKLLAEKTEGETDPDDIPEAPADPVAKPGDVWLLGKHRLVCGDSTDADTVAKALNGVSPHLMITDPPYGVEYDPAWREKAGVAASGTAKGKVLNDDKADWREAWALFPGDVAYVWHAGLFAGVVGDSLAASGFQLRSQIIWDKGQLVLSRGDYHWEHEPCQPAGTMVQKVIARGAGSQPAQIAEVPIETLHAGDHVVSYNSYSSVVMRRGREITRFGERQFDGLMHTISAGGRATRATPEHQFSVRLNPGAANKNVVYLMRRGNWWRVGRVRLFNSRGFGLATRIADNKAEEAWIISVHDTTTDAQCAEQVLSCKYGIPTTHWEIDDWALSPERQRSRDQIAGIYASLNLSALDARATLLLRDHRLERGQPLIRGGERLMFSRKSSRRIRACNLFAEIMQIPMPTSGDDFEWVTLTGNDATPFSGLVYSMDVEGDQHYVADGLITHNCWYAVRKGRTGHWAGDRKQTTVWHIAKPKKNETGHGTQKPVECMKRPIENNSSPGQAVYEPFSGSGTTIIAGEMTGRSIHAIELNPAYVDVAIKRWQDFTGMAATLEGDGRTFNEIAEIVSSDDPASTDPIAEPNHL